MMEWRSDHGKVLLNWMGGICILLQVLSSFGLLTPTWSDESGLSHCPNRVDFHTVQTDILKSGLQKCSCKCSPIRQYRKLLQCREMRKKAIWTTNWTIVLVQGLTGAECRVWLACRSALAGGAELVGAVAGWLCSLLLSGGVRLTSPIQGLGYMRRVCHLYRERKMCKNMRKASKTTHLR